MEKTFDVLIRPLLAYCEKNGESIDKVSDSRTLKFQPFTLTMVFAYLMQVSSLRKLSNKLELSDSAKSLGLKKIPWTTIRDGFTRFSANFFIAMYRSVLLQTQIVRLDSLDELGMISLVDGSIFPTISSMCWAEYKKTKQAIRLHVEFNLAFFIIRIKDNMKFQTIEMLEITGQLPTCLYQVSDRQIQFTNDPNEIVYRLVLFRVAQSEFRICTNRALCLSLAN